MALINRPTTMRLTSRNCLGILLLCGLNSQAVHARAAELSLSLSCVESNITAQAGLAAAALAERCVLTAGTPLWLTYSISNCSPVTQYLTSEDLRLLPSDFIVQRADGTSPASTLMSHRLAQRSGEVIRLGAGTNIQCKVNLLEMFPPVGAVMEHAPSLFEPGTYTVGMKMRIAQSGSLSGEHLWTGVMESQAITVVIEAPTEEQIEGLWRAFERSNAREDTHGRSVGCCIAARSEIPLSAQGSEHNDS